MRRIAGNRARDAVAKKKADLPITQGQRRPSGKKGVQPASLANLIPFKPGQSGNPGGGPRGESITAILRRKLQEPAGKGKTVAEAIADAILNEARKADISFVRELLERADGKVPARLDVRNDTRPPRRLEIPGAPPRIEPDDDGRPGPGDTG
jgi:hypothetical protein